MLVLSMHCGVQMVKGSDCEQRGCRVPPGVQQAGTWLKSSLTIALSMRRGSPGPHVADWYIFRKHNADKVGKTES
jgi:hypothetical protein